ncbi:hypothetical protein [Flavobacterium defluvii]|uniref:Uncharacterized protein n=1 Tax=Flavobacterium defluvii TaxID=370979 RepID=A0A1M5HYM0_9FLAO|nr:hypothetical protein [Flavobacterium defluvii]SHG20992.1 hypothetical protein SAMN05443663_102194 [Flavobacterium defluvii]
MKTIFDKPIILDSEKENVVLIYSDYIIGDITRQDANLAIEKIKSGDFILSEFISVIKVKEIFEYEFEKDVDACIMFGIKNNEGTSYKNIDFKDTETAIKADSLIKEQFEALGFVRKEEQLSVIGASIFPLIVTGIVAVAGGLLTWFAYEMESYENTRTRVVKWYVYLMVKISKSVGYLPFLIITGVLVLLCLFWMVKRMSNPPVKISVIR